MTKFWQTHGAFAASVLLVMAFGLTGCATTASERKSSGNSLKDLAIWAGFATNAEEPADFVKGTRTGNLTYQPVGVTPAGPKKNARKLTPEEERFREKLLKHAVVGTAAQVKTRLDELAKRLDLDELVIVTAPDAAPRVVA